jgi:hypothetical protein
MSFTPREPTAEEFARAEAAANRLLVEQIAREKGTFGFSPSLAQYCREAERQQRANAIAQFNLRLQQDGRSCLDLNRKTYESRKDQFLAALRGRAPR